uniref:Tc1-like transposase DDE domain-containing protein n=1 Tax=Plectus sambesii TaxID=2011161 RepID=A0A914XRB2_9BILA
MKADLGEEFDLSMTSLRQIMRGMGFRFGKINKRSVLFERMELVDKCRTYLLTIEKYRSEKRKIIFCDKTWIFTGMSATYGWMDEYAWEYPNQFKYAGPKVSTSRGKRAIVIHAITKDGLVEGADRIMFQGDNSGDYHDQMNSDAFKKWFVNNVDGFKEGCNGLEPVLVIDNAPYHSDVVESVPTSTWRKKDMQDWLLSKGIQYPIELTKQMLYDEIIRPLRHKHKKYALGVGKAARCAYSSTSSISLHTEPYRVAVVKGEGGFAQA